MEMGPAKDGLWKVYYVTNYMHGPSITASSSHQIPIGLDLKLEKKKKKMITGSIHKVVVAQSTPTPTAPPTNPSLSGPVLPFSKQPYIGVRGAHSTSPAMQRHIQA